MSLKNQPLEDAGGPHGEETPDPPGDVCVRRVGSVRKGHEYGLVALSQGVPYSVERAGDAFEVRVERLAADRVARQMEFYDHESRYWPPVPLRVPDHGGAGWAAGGWAAVLAGGYAVQIEWAPAREAGLADASAIIGGGEVERAVTALTLHADAAHLGANLVFGGFFLYWAARSFGAGRALLATLVGGTMGNLLNAWFYFPEAHRSLGASTAVFATIGLLAAYPAGRGLRLRRSLWSRTGWLPLVGGAALLGWFGGGGGDGRVDVTAHLFGFFAGLIVGFFLAWRAAEVAARDRFEWVYAFFAAGLLALGWGAVVFRMV